MRKMMIFILVAILSITLIGCGNNEENEVAMKEQEDQSKTNYSVAEEEDISTISAKRYKWHVVVEEDLSKEELENLAKDIVEEAKEGKKFNAITIGFYDYEEYIGTGYTLGMVEYAPGGKWSEADTVDAGDYDKMDYDFDLREKDWDKRLTKEEVDIYTEWQNLYNSQVTTDDLPDEDEVSQDIAIKFDITKEEVDDILMKQITWAFDNN